MAQSKFQKWGRGALCSGLCAFLITLSSCGTGKNSASTSVPDEKTDVITSSGVMNPEENRDEYFPTDPLERLSGRFYIDGDSTAASVAIEPDGRFTAYYASGTAEQQGYVRYEADGSGFNVYVFYTDEGKPYMGFVDSGESRISEFETGNGGYRFVRVK